MHISRLVSRVTVAVALLVIVAAGAGATTPVRSPISPPGANYPWVQPYWVIVHGMTHAKAPTRVPDASGLEPSWINAKGITPPTVASLPGATYPWVQPYWVTVHGATHAKLPTVAGRTGNADVEPIWVKVDGLTLPALPS